MANGKGTYLFSCITANHPKNHILNDEKSFIRFSVKVSIEQETAYFKLWTIDNKNLDVTVSIEHLRSRNTENRV